MKQTPISVAMAILYQNRHFLMQLRDDKDYIPYSGQWGLFGGHLETGESPSTGLIREIKEEINYFIAEPIFFRCYKDNKAYRHIFFASLDINIKSLKLNEGWDLDLVSLSSVRLGRHYSHEAGEERFIGDIHRRILLDFDIFARNNILTFDHKSY